MQPIIEYEYIDQEIVTVTVSAEWSEVYGVSRQGKYIAVTKTFIGFFATSDAEEWASEMAKTVEDLFKQL
jgi:hypothetical protein